MKIASLHTVILYVQDMSSARDFFEGVLNFAPGYHSDAFVKYDLGGTYLALHAGGSGEKATATVVCFAVDDIAELRSHLQSHGIETPADFHQTPNGPIMEFQSPEGHLLQAIQLN